MKAILTSKRFNPGHISHIEANARLLEDEGFEVLFSLHKKFFEFAPEKFIGKKFSLSSYRKLSYGDLYITWFPSVAALLRIIFIRLFSEATIIYVYHEPFTSYSSYRRAGFSHKKAIKIAAIALVNRLSSKIAHKIILPSERAYNAIPEATADTCRFAKINLLFYDEAEPGSLIGLRPFISYIGTIAEDHAFEEFVKLAEGCISNKLLLPYKFLIATRSVIPDEMLEVVQRGIQSGRLVVHSGTPMTNEEINRHYAQSRVIWNGYKRSMQSGVLPKAYMFGTPVVVTESNKSEYFIDGVHGIKISDTYKLDEFHFAINEIESSWPLYSKNCRKFYLENFDYRAVSKKFIDFVLDLT